MNRRPARDIGQSSETGADTLILPGMPGVMESSVYSAPLTGGTPPNQMPNTTRREMTTHVRGAKWGAGGGRHRATLRLGWAFDIYVSTAI